MMNNLTPQTYTSRETVLQQVLKLVTYIVAGSFIAMSVSVIVLAFAYQVVLIWLSIGMLLAATIWAYKSIGTPVFSLGLFAFTSTTMLVGITMAFFIHGGEYLIPATVLLVLMFLALANRTDRLFFTTGVGLGLFIIFALINHLEILEALHYEQFAIIELIIPVISTFIIATSAVLLFLLNQVLQHSIVESEQRHMEAEKARDEAHIALDITREQAANQARMLELIQDLETPVIPVLPGTLVLPIVGHLDTRRIVALTDNLLDTIDESHAHTVLVDMTGVSLIDTATANHLMQLVNSARLLGARCILTGIRAEVAQTLVMLGVDWSSIPTAPSLQEAILELYALNQED